MRQIIITVSVPEGVEIEVEATQGEPSELPNPVPPKKTAKKKTSKAVEDIKEKAAETKPEVNTDVEPKHERKDVRKKMLDIWSMDDGAGQEFIKSVLAEFKANQFADIEDHQLDDLYDRILEYKSEDA